VRDIDAAWHDKFASMNLLPAKNKYRSMNLLRTKK